MQRPLLLIAAILAALSSIPMARAADEPPPFGESIDVRVVNVEAVVTDRAGNRVTGLKPGDFRLRVDGKEVPVEYFSEVQAGQALAAAAPAEAGKPEAGAAVPGLAEGRSPESTTTSAAISHVSWLWIPALAPLGRNDGGAATAPLHPLTSSSASRPSRHKD